MTDRRDPQDGEDRNALDPERIAARDALDITAAEYVLGLLEPSQHAEVAQRLAADADLRRSVALWTRRLEPLLEDAHNEAARAGLLRKIEREVAASRAHQAADVPDTTSEIKPVAVAGAAPSPTAGVVQRAEEVRRIERERAFAEKRLRSEERRARKAARPARVAERPDYRRRGLWGSLVFWRGLSLTAVAACAALMVAVVTEQDLRPYYDPVLSPIAERYGVDLPRGPLVAALAPAEGADVFLLSYQGGRLSAQTVSIDTEDLVPELWLVPDDGSAPLSLGILPPPGDAVAIDVPQAARLAALADGTTLAVSLEPVGGAPNGVTTGPIIAQGRLVRP